MSNQLLLRRFAEIGARAKLVQTPGRPRIDVRLDRAGEYFELRVVGNRAVVAHVVDADRTSRRCFSSFAAVDWNDRRSDSAPPPRGCSSAGRAPG